MGCEMCEAPNKKLFKRYYMNYKVYVCAYCIKTVGDQLDVEEKVNG